MAKKAVKKPAAKKAAKKRVTKQRTKKVQVSGMPGLDALKNPSTGIVDQQEHIDSLTENS